MSGTVQKPGSLGRLTRLTLYGASLGVWFSGGLWLLLHNFFLRRGEFGPEVNPLEPWCLKVHGAFAFAAVWFFGLLWGVHVTKLWPLSWRRWSGGAMAGIVALLTLTGYLLYYVGDDKVRSLVSVLHWAIGLVAPLFFAWHRIRFRRKVPRPFLDALSFRRLFHAKPGSASGTKKSEAECARTSMPSRVEKAERRTETATIAGGSSR